MLTEEALEVGQKVATALAFVFPPRPCTNHNLQTILEIVHKLQQASTGQMDP